MLHYQVFTQTGDDNMDIEIQTDEVQSKNKWTQFPITCRKELYDKRDIDLFKMVIIHSLVENSIKQNNNSINSMKQTYYAKFCIKLCRNKMVLETI